MGIVCPRRTLLTRFTAARACSLHDRTSQGEIMNKLAEQMLALLAVCVALCPGQMPQDQVYTLLRKTHGDLSASGDRIKAMGSGSDEGLKLFADMFQAACPNFLPATVDPSVDMLASARETFENQAALFQAEITQRVRLLSAARAYLRLYTNISTEKLSEFQRKPAESVQCVLAPRSRPTAPALRLTRVPYAPQHRPHWLEAQDVPEPGRRRPGVGVQLDRVRPASLPHRRRDRGH